MLLAYEHSLVRPGDLRRLDAAFFTMNGVISVAFFVFVLLDVALVVRSLGTSADASRMSSPIARPCDNEAEIASGAPRWRPRPQDGLDSSA